MKKILFVLSSVAVLLGAASCEKDNLGGNKETKPVDNPLNIITVTTDTDSKLAIDDETLTPAFEIDDVIFGWDSEGTAYAYTCTEVTEDAATFTRTSSGAPSADEGTVVNLVYAPGYEIEDIVDKTLDVNLAVQGETLPVIMHISGTVDEEGICKVTFLNDVAIVDVKDAVLPDAVEDEEYTVSFHGKNTSLKFTLDEDGSLVVAPAVEGPISSSEKAKVSADSKISKKFAVPASLEATDVIIAAMAADGSTYTFSAGSKEIAAGKYIKVAGKEFAPQYVAQIGDKKYMRILDAVDAANAATSDVTIELLSDIAKVPHSMTFNNESAKVVTVDFKDCMINSTMNPAVICSTSVVFVDNGPLKKGGITGTSQVLAMRGGDNVISGGNYTGHNTYGVMRVSNNTKVVINEGVTMTADDKSRVINAGSNSDNPGGETVINGGTFKSTNWGPIRCTFGNLTINGGTFVSECDSVIYASSSTGSAEIKGGYFFATKAAPATSPESYVGGPGISKKISGGKFSHKVESAYCATGKVCKALSPAEVVDGRSYAYEIVDGVSYVAHIGFTNYETFQAALTDAKLASEDVEIVMDDNTELSGINNDFTNANGKTITVNLNGKTMTTTARNSIVTTGNLVITGTEDGQGLLKGSTNRIIFIQGKGSVKLKNCTFQTSGTNYNTVIDSSAIVVHGSSSEKDGKIEVENVIANTGTGRTSLFGVNYGTLNIKNSELSVNGKGYHCIKSTSGAKIKIESSSIYTAKDPDRTCNCIYTSGKTNASISIISSYLYAESGECIRNHSYAGAVTITSGYFNCNVSTISPDVQYVQGATKSDCSETHTHAGKSYTYTWKVTAPTE